VAFMSFRDDQQGYDLETVFAQEQLAAVRPADVKRWLCQKVSGNPNPSPADKHTRGRFSSLEFYKKGPLVRGLHGEPTFALERNYASRKSYANALQAESGIEEHMPKILHFKRRWLWCLLYLSFRLTLMMKWKRICWL
jgi:hypothetical protein